MRALIVLAILTGTAYADPEPQTQTEYYGGTIAVVDGISVGVLGGGIALIATQDSGGLRVLGIITTVIGAGGYIWGSPIVHYLRDRDELAKIDIGLRVIVPGLSAGIAAGVTPCPEGDGACDKRVIATLIAGAAGIVLVSALDIAVFAKRQVPYVAPTPGGATVGMVATF